MEHTKRKSTAIAHQYFNGRRYNLYRGEKYFLRHEKRMHVEVWEHFNGPVPKGYHIHHKDENKHNNHIDNLECIEGKKHISMHAGSKDSWINSAKGKEHTENVRELTKAWHASEEGKEWHRQHALNFNFGKQTYGLANCLYCSKEYTKGKADSKFCSNNCKTQHRRVSGVDNVEKVCITCAKPFMANKYLKAVNCSSKCAAAYRNELAGITKN